MLEMDDASAENYPNEKVLVYLKKKKSSILMY